MRVPAYNQQRVNLAAVPNVNLPTDSPDYAGSIGRMTEAAGNFAAQTQRGLELVRRKEQEDADIFRVEGQINKLRALETDLTTGPDGAMRLKGENVFNLGEPLTGVYSKRWDEGVADLQAGLGNDNQRRKFQVLSGRLKQQFTGQLSTHEANESKVVRESAFKGVVASESEAVARALDDPNETTRTEAIGFSIGRVKANAERYYRTELGLSKELVDAQVLVLESSMHKTVIDRYLEQNNPIDAKRYFEANKDRINDKDSTVARKQIEKDGRDFMVAKAADDIWLRMGPKGDADPVNLDLMEREANRAFERDADGRKLLISEIRQRQQAHDYSAKERTNATIGGIWKQVMAGGSLAGIRRSNEFRTLDGKSQAVMIGQIEDFQKPKTDPNASIQKFAEYWAVVSDPQRLATMSDAEIFAKAPVMGTELVKQALVTKANLSKQETKVIEAEIDQDSFNYFARQAGIDPLKDNNKGTLGELKYRLETLVDTEQRARGNKPLNREEKDNIIKKMMVEVPVTVKGHLWGTTTENRKVFEVKYPENIAIPAKDKAMIAEALKKAGIQNPTDSQIREGYIRLKMK